MCLREAIDNESFLLVIKFSKLKLAITKNLMKGTRTMNQTILSRLTSFSL